MLNAYTSSLLAPLAPFPRMLHMKFQRCSSLLVCKTDGRTLRTKALECWVATRSIGFDREVAGDANGRLGPSRTARGMASTTSARPGCSAAAAGVARSLMLCCRLCTRPSVRTRLGAASWISCRASEVGSVTCRAIGMWSGVPRIGSYYRAICTDDSDHFSTAGA